MKSIRSTLLKVDKVDRVALAQYTLASGDKSTISATKLTVSATVNFVADLLPVSATVNFVVSVYRALVVSLYLAYEEQVFFKHSRVHFFRLQHKQ